MKARYIDLTNPNPMVDAAIDAILRLGKKPKTSDLAMVNHDARKDVVEHIERYEVGRHALLDEHAEKDEDGNKKTEPVMHDGEPVMGANGPVETVVMKDMDAFRVALGELLDTEVEIVHGFKRSDFKGQPAGFTLENELDALGPLLIED